MKADRTLFGIALVLAFCVQAPLLDLFSKLAAEDGIPVGEIAFARFLVQGLFMVPILLWLRPALALGGRAWLFVVVRSLLLLAAAFAFVVAVRVMPLADALAITFVQPFILLFLSHLLLGDEVGPRRIIASIIGFAGAVLIVRPSVALYGMVALWPLATALFFALYMLATRAIAEETNAIAMQFHTSWIIVVVLLPVLVALQDGPIPDLSFVMPRGYQWWWLVAVGFWGCFSHLCLTFALSFAPAATIAPLQYFEIAVAVLAGYAVFGDVPNELTLAGIAVIVGSGLYIIQRERVSARTKRAAAQALNLSVRRPLQQAGVGEESPAFPADQIQDALGPRLPG